jgi:predicted lipoprotein with Yx(FWY)xxD motif
MIGRCKTWSRMTMKPILLFAGLAFAAPAWANPPQTPVDVSIFQEEGRYVPRTSETSMPIYTFDNDRPGVSNCNDACAERWPPLIATPHMEPVGDFTLVIRKDRQNQWAWKGKPLYTFAGDEPAKPRGDGIGGVWHLIAAMPPVEPK